MKNVAFIIPIHPPHYHFIYPLIDKIYQTSFIIDIYLVFSNEQDYNLFIYKDKIKHIIIPQIETNNIVTFKKFYALEKLKDDLQYDYFIVCDSEITIVPENFTETNILNKINKIYENKIVYAGEQPNNTDFMNIIKHSANLICNESESEKITKNYTMYYWWSDLPVYKREYLADFFSKIDYSNIVWYHFDHIIYLNYLILYHEFDIIDMTRLINHWSFELYNPIDHHVQSLKSNKYGFSFITNKIYNNNKQFFINEGSFILFHLDR